MVHLQSVMTGSLNRKRTGLLMRPSTSVGMISRRNEGGRGGCGREEKGRKEKGKKEKGRKGKGKASE